jgi:hypothetical protein
VKRKKLSNRKSLIKKLDATFSLYIRGRDRNKCFTCGSQQNPTCGHLITRAKYSVRWDARNALCQCASCNLRHEFDSHIFTIKWIEKFGLPAYKQLVRDGAISHKFTDTELEELVDYFKEKLATLKTE